VRFPQSPVHKLLLPFLGMRAKRLTVEASRLRELRASAAPSVRGSSVVLYSRAEQRHSSSSLACDVVEAPYASLSTWRKNAVIGLARTPRRLKKVAIAEMFEVSSSCTFSSCSLDLNPRRLCLAPLRSPPRGSWSMPPKKPKAKPVRTSPLSVSFLLTHVS